MSEKMRAFIDTKVFAIAPRAHNIILFISCQVPAGFKETGQEKGVYNMNCSTVRKVKIKKKGVCRNVSPGFKFNRSCRFSWGLSTLPLF